MDFDFDLETCQVELERVRDLLTVVIEFMDEELPAKPEFDYETVLFARRAGTFGSVIEAAFSKTDAIIQSIDKSINDFYHKGKAEKEKPSGKTKERTVEQ